MGKTYTDFSQLSKGMFKKSDPVVEIKPIPKKTAGGDDALAYFGLNAPQPPSGASGAKVGNALEARVKAAEAQIVSIGAERDAVRRKAANLERQLAVERQMREAAEAERERLRDEVMRLRNELEDALTAPSSLSAT